MNGNQGLLNQKHALDARLGWTIIGVKMKKKIDSIKYVSGPGLEELAKKYSEEKYKHVLAKDAVKEAFNSPKYEAEFTNSTHGLALVISENKEFKEIVNKNIEKLTSKEFENAKGKESVGGNAGKYHAAVNAFITKDGEIKEFSNRPSNNPDYQGVTFSIDRSCYIANRDKNVKGPVIDNIFAGEKLKKGNIVKEVIDKYALLKLHEAVKLVNEKYKK